MSKKWLTGLPGHRIGALLVIAILPLVAASGCDRGPSPTATRSSLASPRPTFTAVAVALSGVPATPTPRLPATGTPAASVYPYPVITPTPTPTPTPQPLNLADQPPMTIRDWPRPPGDNGRGMHFLIHPYYEEAELDEAWS